MIDKINSLLEEHTDIEELLKSILKDFLAKSSEEDKGIDNMTALLIKFK